MRIAVPLIACFLAFPLPSFADESATIRMRFRYDGNPPPSREITPDRDKPFCGRKRIPDESLIVNPVNRGIQNVVVYLDSRQNRSMNFESNASPATLNLRAKDCRFEPHIVIAKKNDTLRFQIDDRIGHNAKISFLNNPPIGIVLPAKGDARWELRESEPVPVSIECNIHPWMQAWLVVLDHSFVAASDEDGKIEIRGLPVDTEITFRVFHESGRIREVQNNGKPETWSRGHFRCTLESGVNDLGIMDVPPASFQR